MAIFDKDKDPFSGAVAGGGTSTTGIVSQDVSKGSNDGAACTTADGRSGVMRNGVCVASGPATEKKEPEISPLRKGGDETPQPGITGLSQPLPKTPNAPVTMPPTPMPKGSPTWYYPEEIQAGNFDTPSIPQRYTNPYLNRTAKEVYDTLGIKTENWYGELHYTDVPEVSYGTHLALPDKYFNHNVPLAVWLDDNTLVKADNVNDFANLVQYTQNNQKYLPTSVYDKSVGQMSTNQMNPAQFMDFIEARKRFDTPARKDYQYWKTREEMASNFEADVARLEELLIGEDWAYGDAFPSGLTGEPAALAARIKRRQGRVGRGDETSQEDYMSEIAAGLNAATEAYAAELSGQLPEGWTAEVMWRTEKDTDSTFNFMEDAEETKIATGIKTRQKTPFEKSTDIVLKAQDWSIANGVYTTAEGQTYKAPEIIASPDLMNEYKGKLGESTVKEMVEWATDNETEFLEMMGKYGDTPDTRIIINEMFPDVDDKTINKLFDKFRTPQQKRAQGITEANQIKELVNQPYSIENEKRLNELLPPMYRSTGGVAFANPMLSDSQYTETDIFRPIIKSAWQRSLYSGIGNVQTSAAGVAGRFGWDGISERMFAKGSKLQALAMPQTDSMMLNLAYGAIQTVPFMVAFIPLALIGAAGGTAIGVGAGLGALGTLIVEAVGATAMSRPAESMIEAGDALNQAIAKGYSEEQANKVFDTVFWNNMTLAGADAIQFASAFAPMPAPLRAALNNKALAKITMVGGKVAFNGLTEGGEEVYQSYLQANALGEEVTDEEMLQAGLLGGMMGMAIGGVGDVYSSVQSKTVENLPTDVRIDVELEIADTIDEQLNWSEDQKQAWAQFTEENPSGSWQEFDAWAKGQTNLKDSISGPAQAKKEVLDRLTESSPAEVQQAVEAAVEEVKQQVLSDEMQRSQERVVAMQNEPIEQTEESINEQIADIQQTIYEQSEEIAALEVSIDENPVRKVRFRVPTKKEKNGKLVYRDIGLESFISIREGTFPEYFTIKQAKMIKPHGIFTEWSQPGTKQYDHVPKDIVLDNIADSLNMSIDGLTDAVMDIRSQRQQLADLKQINRVGEDELTRLRELQKKKAPAWAGVADTGIQKGMMGVADKNVEVMGKGRIVQGSMDEQAKLQRTLSETAPVEAERASEAVAGAETPVASETATQPEATLAPLAQGPVESSGQVVESESKFFEMRSQYENITGDHNQMHIADQIEKSTRYVAENEQYVQKMFMGLAPNVRTDITDTAIFLAYADKLRADGKDVEAALVDQANLWRGQRKGQEIVMFRAANDNSPIGFIKDALAAKIESKAKDIGGSGAAKEKVNKQIQKDIKNLKKEIKDSDFKAAQKLIDDLTC